MDDVATIERVIDQLNRTVGAVGADQWDAATPCTEWTARDLVNHMTGGSKLFATCVRDGSMSDDQLIAIMTEDQLGDDPAGAFARESAGAIEAFRGTDGDPMVSLPFGTMPASAALDLAIFDLMVHTVDLAIATGQDLDSIDPELLSIALDRGPALMPEDHRMPGMMDAPVAIADDAHPALRLAAFAGRAV